MNTTDWSSATSWTSHLFTILRPAPDPLRKEFGHSCSRFRHSPGDIWRHALSSAVYHDLAGPALAHDSHGAVRWRRFVRVEHLGLSGVIFYEIPTSPLSSAPETTVEDFNSRSARHGITLRSVFGDKEDQTDEGMDLEDLLDALVAKVVYFPAYACTSFIVGQVMTAFLSDRPARQPYPAYHGFSVRVGEPHKSVEDASTLSFAVYSSKLVDNYALGSDSTDDFYSWSPRAAAGGTSTLPSEDLALAPDDPYIALCIRSSTLHDMTDSPSRTGVTNSLSEKQVFSTVVSTAGSDIQSSEPTPAPPTSQSFVKTAQDLYIYKEFISFLDFGATTVEG